MSSKHSKNKNKTRLLRKLEIWSKVKYSKKTQNYKLSYMYNDIWCRNSSILLWCRKNSKVISNAWNYYLNKHHKLSQKWGVKYPSISFHIFSPERKYSGGLFGLGSTSFLEFVVTTSAVNWSVGRRYSDFIWFRNILKKFFPSLIIPPIPNKKAAKRSSRQIEKRMRILTYFLNDLVKIPEIVNSKYF